MEHFSASLIGTAISTTLFYIPVRIYIETRAGREQDVFVETIGYAVVMWIVINIISGILLLVGGLTAIVLAAFAGVVFLASVAAHNLGQKSARRRKLERELEYEDMIEHLKNEESK